jgi:hypothetical protein
MSETLNIFEGKVVPLLKSKEHPLLRQRIELSARLGEIMLDMDRYNSSEWFDVVAAITEVTKQIRAQGVDTSRFHSSIGFPMRYNPAAKVVRGEKPEMPIFDTTPTEPAQLAEAA